MTRFKIQNIVVHVHKKRKKKKNHIVSVFVLMILFQALILRSDPVTAKTLRVKYILQKCASLQSDSHRRSQQELKAVLKKINKQQKTDLNMVQKVRKRGFGHTSYDKACSFPF